MLLASRGSIQQAVSDNSITGIYLYSGAGYIESFNETGDLIASGSFPNIKLTSAPKSQLGDIYGIDSLKSIIKLNRGLGKTTIKTISSNVYAGLLQVSELLNLGIYESEEGGIYTMKKIDLKTGAILTTSANLDVMANNTILVWNNPLGDKFYTRHWREGYGAYNYIANLSTMNNSSLVNNSDSLMPLGFHNGNFIYNNSNVIYNTKGISATVDTSSRTFLNSVTLCGDKLYIPFDYGSTIRLEEWNAESLTFVRVISTDLIPSFSGKTFNTATVSVANGKIFILVSYKDKSEGNQYARFIKIDKTTLAVEINKNISQIGISNTYFLFLSNGFA